MRTLSLYLCLIVCHFLALPSIALSEVEVFSFSEGNLYRLPLAEFSPEYVGPTGHNPTALDFSPTSVLFAIDPSEDVLLTIDETNGNATVIGNLGLDVDEQHSDITFDSSGRLWMSSGYALYLVDLQSGLATFQIDANPGLSDGGWIGLTFVGNLLYGDYAWLHTIDPATGDAQPVEHNWPYWGMDSLGSGQIWAIENYNTFQNEWYALTVVDPETDSHIAFWRISVDIPYNGIAVRSVATPAIPTLEPVGVSIFSLAVCLAAIWIIRRR